MYFEKWISFMTLLELIIKIPIRNVSAAAKTSSIVGGYACKTRKPEIAKYMISLTGFWGTPICGGTLVNPYFVLSAAHCNAEVATLYASRAYDRDRFIRKDGLLAWWCPVTKVDEVFRHPNYNFGTLENDIAMMRLEKPITTKTYKDFVKLPHKGNKVKFEILPTYNHRQNPKLEKCSHVTAVGWGTIVSGHYYVVPKELMCVELPVVDNIECRVFLRRSNPSINDNHVCAGGVEGKDTCIGDSGGPLLCDDYQYGITSWGPECAQGFPAVYTRVEKYLDFINDIVANSSNITDRSFCLFFFCSIILFHYIYF